MNALRIATAAAVLAQVIAAGAAADWTVVGCDRMDVAILRGDAPVFVLRNDVGGPDWKGGRLAGPASVRDGKVRVFEQDGIGFYVNWFDQQPLPGRFDLRYELRQTAPDTVVARYACRPEFDTRFGLPGRRDEKTISIGLTLPPTPYFKGGRAVVTYADGKTEDAPLPIPYGSKTGVSGVALTTAGGETTRLAFDPPAILHLDHNELRVRAAGTAKAGGEFVGTIAIALPQAAAFEPANRLADTSGWYPLDFAQAEDFAAPSAIGLEDWLDRPAGRRGWLRMKGRDFAFEDGARGKFWGINICGPHAAPEREEADRWADRCAKHGVNLVRFHKTLNHIAGGWALDDKSDSTKLNEERAAKFDYFSAALARRGVYQGWSAFYAYKLSPADKDRVAAWDELMAKGEQWFKGSTIMLVNFAPDLQDLHIRALLNLLTRTNTVTGVRYADDRALAYIEIQNEDDIFFPGLDRQVKACPTYYAMMKRQFSDWLRAKYRDEAAWKTAWSDKIRPEEDWSGGTVDPFADSLYDLRAPSRRVLDVYAYLYDAQTAYYRKVSQALRDAGYGGAICGSCWQTATFLGHLYNVRSDREVGFIDRHNYGGGNMLVRPGGGLLSAGMQQVGDRPYNFSEWSGGGVFGGLEMVPVIGFIGMGVQGWDISAHFASNAAGLSRRPGGDVCDQFVNLCQYPAIARALYRGDFLESLPVAVRRVSLPRLADGDVGFQEEFSLLGGANIKEFSAVVPQEALGVGPVVLEFVDGPVETAVEDRSARFIDRARQVVTSASGQVRWDYSGRGFFTLDTPGTQGVAGYGGGRVHALTDLALEPRNPLAFVYVSARGPKETIAKGASLVVTVLGRAAHEGTVLDDVAMAAIERAKEPEKARQLLEPVAVTVTLKRKDPCRVIALDHGGRRTSPPVEVPVAADADGQRFTLDGAVYKTPYYLVEFGVR
jgi:hypothetical protein